MDVIRAATRAVFSHARQKVLLGLVLAVVATIIQYVLAIRDWNGTQKMLFSLAASAVIVMVFSFLWNILSTPVAMDNDQREALRDRERQIAANESRISELPTAPQETVLERSIRELVAHATEEDKALLRRFLLHGEQDERLIDPSDRSGDAMSHCRELGLIVERYDRPARLKYFGIPKRFEDTLQRMLSEES